MSAWHAITLVAWREIHERLHSRVFLVSTLLMVALVAASSAMSGMLSKERTYKVAVTWKTISGAAPSPSRSRNFLKTWHLRI